MQIYKEKAKNLKGGVLLCNEFGVFQGRTYRFLACPLFGHSRRTLRKSGRRNERPEVQKTGARRRDECSR
jgi:hypothetical protein